MGRERTQFLKGDKGNAEAGERYRKTRVRAKGLDEIRIARKFDFVGGEVKERGNEGRTVKV